MKLKIKLIHGQSQLADFEIPMGDKVSFGRSPEADIQLNDQTASRVHCEIDYTNDTPVLRDLNSSNGTMVNEERIDADFLLNGHNTITIGSHVFSTEFNQKTKVADNPILSDVLETTIDLSDADSDFDINAISYSQKFDFTQGPLRTTEKLDHQLQTITRRVNDICTFSSRILAMADSKEVLAAAVEAVLDITGAQRCSAILLDISSNLLDPVTFKCSDEFQHQGKFPVSTTIVRHVISSGESIISTNTADDDRFMLGASISAQNISSVMCVPLIGQENVIGTLYADNTDGYNSFDEEALAIMAVVGHQSAVAVERLSLVKDLKRLFFGSIHALAASIEAKDRYTRGHSERVTCYSLMIADELGLDEKERSVTELAGLLHDVGKIAIPEGVLCSTSKLGDEEFKLMQEHPDRGAEIILKMPELSRLASVKEVANGARHHHEKFDGSGYPDKLCGEKIPLISRILAVADTFDAITSTRTYRKGQTTELALDIINKCSGTQFDPKVVEAFGKVCERGDIARPDKVRANIQFNKALLAQSTANKEAGTTDNE